MVSNIVNDVLSKKNREKEVFNSNNVSSGVNGGKATVSINETYSFQTEEDYPLNRKVDIKIKFDGYLENNFSMHGEVDFETTVSYPYPGKHEYSEINYVGISFRDSSGVYRFAGVIRFDGEVINGYDAGTYNFEINGDTYSEVR